MKLKAYVTLGFAIFTAGMLWLALALSRSRPAWLVAGTIVLGALVVIMVYARLSFWEGSLEKPGRERPEKAKKRDRAAR